MGPSERPEWLGGRRAGMWVRTVFREGREHWALPGCVTPLVPSL